MGIIVVAVDGSPSSERAVRWCADHAAALGATVLAVHAVDTGGIGTFMALDPALPAAVATDDDRSRLAEVVEHEWCKPLADAGVEYHVIVADGRPTAVLKEIGQRERVELVVTGHRGRGGVTELLLGSTSNQLAHHLNRPLLIVP